MGLGRIGVWDWRLRFGDPGEIGDAAAELEELGCSALWVPDVGGELFPALADLLDATSRAVVATGILNIWLRDPRETATWRAGLPGGRRERLLLGLGVSHAALIDAQEGLEWRRPLARMASFLDDLASAHPPVPPEGLVLGALGPRMLELARERAGGAHPYFVVPEHTHRAREVLGADRLLAPEQAVALESEPSRAREIGREHLATYLSLPNYTNNLRRLGFGDDDLAEGGSDRLVDALVAWGDEDDVARRVAEHFDAGADHVAVQVLGGDAPTPPLAEWRVLAPALLA